MSADSDGAVSGILPVIALCEFIVAPHPARAGDREQAAATAPSHRGTYHLLGRASERRTYLIT
jgi:hypothetical protein